MTTQSTEGPDIRRFPADKQARMDELLDLNNDGVISPDEELELDRLVEEAQRLMIDNLRRMEAFYGSPVDSQRGRAVPIAVWVREEALATG